MATSRRRSLVDFSSPAAGFDQPLALWNACHDRVQRMARLLVRLCGHVRTVGVDADASAGATSVRRYFDEAAPHHHEDEEKDLFPRLRERAPQLGEPRSGELLGALVRLDRDHVEIGALWQALRLPLKRIENGEKADLDEAKVTQFFNRYQDHIRIEDTVVAAALEELLTAADLVKVGQAMAQRRGVEWRDLTD
jgi:hemerythrin-like domain-containing protein